MIIENHPKLYHGTRASMLDSILSLGISPRENHGNTQWAHTVESRADAVYLTSAYPLHFAVNAQDDSDVILLEVDVSLLDENKLIADEDALAYEGKIGSSKKREFPALVKHFRAISEQYPASVSLAAMGTCAYLGAVPPGAITRIARIDVKHLPKLILGGIDPSVGPLNYALFGSEYEQSVRWLFGNEPDCQLNPRLSRPLIEVMVLPRR